MGFGIILTTRFGMLCGLLTIYIVYITWDKSVANTTWKSNEKRYFNVIHPSRDKTLNKKVKIL